jgi:hypothetical protein
VTAQVDGKKSRSTRRKLIDRSGQTEETLEFSPKDQEKVRVGSREICRACPASKVQIRRVLSSCLRKETRSRLP